MIPASAIRWQLESTATDLTDLSDIDLMILYAAEAASLRRTLHVALQLLHDERRAHLRVRAAHHRLIDEFRTWRASHDAGAAA